VDLTEAVRTQTLIDWLINPHATTDVQADAARDAAAWLADRAHHLTHVGPTAAQVLAGWDDLLEGCFGCPTCTPDPADDIEDQGDAQGDEDDVDDDRDGGVSASGGADRPDRVLSQEDLQTLVAQGWIAPRSREMSAQAPHPLGERGIPGPSGAGDGPAAAVAAGEVRS
jgi:hypothetical protein